MPNGSVLAIPLQQLELAFAGNKILDLERQQLRPSLAIAVYFCRLSLKVQGKCYFRIILLFSFFLPKEVNCIPFNFIKTNILIGQVYVSYAVHFL